jgi:hypothetical protein
MHQFGKVDGALLYAQLFCPRFVEIEGKYVSSRFAEVYGALSSPNVVVGAVVSLQIHLGNSADA